VKPVSADIGLTGIPLAAGQHQVALDYQLPGLRVGLMLGALGWGLLVLIGFKKPHE